MNKLTSIDLLLLFFIFIFFVIFIYYLYKFNNSPIDVNIKVKYYKNDELKEPLLKNVEIQKYDENKQCNEVINNPGFENELMITNNNKEFDEELETKYQNFNKNIEYKNNTINILSKENSKELPIANINVCHLIDKKTSYLNMS